MSSPSAVPPDEGRLDSWKQIAAYLDKSERTVRRWQQTEGLPVHKHLHQQRGSVWAYQNEIDQWLAQRRVSPEPLEEDGVTREPVVATRRMPWSALAAMLGVGVIGAGGWVYTHRPSGPIPAPVPFTALPGSEYGASFSPDGQQAVFFWTGNRSSSNSLRAGLYIRSIESEQVTPLVVTADGFNYSPAWSPDGKTIAFLRRTQAEETWLCLISAAGGPERKLALLSRRARLTANQRHIAWSNDSRWLLAPHSVNRDTAAAARISLDGEIRPITKPGEYGVSLALAPDGLAYVYLRIKGSFTGTYEIMLQRLAPDATGVGEPQSIFQGQGRSSGIDWAPSGKELILCAEGVAPADRLESRLYRLPARPGAQPSLIGSGSCNTVTVSRPDGSGHTALLYGGTRPSRVTILQAPLDGLDQASEFVPSSRADAFPSFSPDGNSVAFTSNRSGQHEVWVVSVGKLGREAGAPKRFTEGAQARSRPDWSPDGARLLFGSALSEPPGLSMLPIAGGSARAVPLGGELGQDPIWSRDGQSIYYSSGGNLIRVRSDGTGRVVLGKGGRYIPVGESADGNSIYSVKVNPHTLLVRIPTGGGAEEIIESDLAWRYVAMTKQGLYFVGNGPALYRLPFGEKHGRKIGPLPGPQRALQGLTVSPDDKRVLWAVTGEPQVDLELVRNFQ